MKFISVCSGIGSSAVAWLPAGWRAEAFAEIEPFPSAVLAHHYPDVPNRGDMTRYQEWPDVPDLDLLMGGTPCQSFSVAGLRQGLADPRGNLALVFLGLVDRFRPRWVVWENVAGVLSSNGGRDFGTFLGALGQLGYGWAYRVLDAQYFGVAQRRRRVFVVGHRGGWRRAAAVLFERESLSGDPAPAHAEGEVTWWNGAPVSQTLDAVLHKGQMLPEKNRFPVIAVGEESCLPPTATPTEIARVAELTTPSVGVLDRLRTSGLSTAKTTTASSGRVVLRRITPTEAEALQGFPADYTAIPCGNKPADRCPASPRFKAIGNSVAVPVLRWIGDRISTLETA